MHLGHFGERVFAALALCDVHDAYGQTHRGTVGVAQRLGPKQPRPGPLARPRLPGDLNVADGNSFRHDSGENLSDLASEGRHHSIDGPAEACHGRNRANRGERGIDVQTAQVAIENGQADRRRLDQWRRGSRPEPDEVGKSRDALLFEATNAGGGPRRYHDQHQRLEPDHDRQAHALVVQAGPLAHESEPRTGRNDDQRGGQKPAKDLAGDARIAPQANEDVVGGRRNKRDARRDERN